MAASELIGCIPGRGAVLRLHRGADRRWPLVLSRDPAGVRRHEALLSPAQARELCQAALALRTSPPRRRAWLLAAASGFVLLEAVGGDEGPPDLRISSRGPRGGELWTVELFGGAPMLEALAEMAACSLEEPMPAKSATRALLCSPST